MGQDAPATVRGGSVLGSGLSALSYGVVLLISVALFLGYGGPLWTSRGSHGMRFVVSYLCVIPLAALILQVTKRLTWGHLVTAVGTIWAIKLLVTALLYYGLAPGGALEDIGARSLVSAAPQSSTTAPSAAPPTVASYEPATGKLIAGELRGVVSGAAGPTVVMLERPAPGAPLGDGSEVVVALSADGFDQPAYVMHTSDTLRIRNTDQRMHALRVRDAKRTRLSAPVPPGGETSAIEPGNPGTLTIACANHTGESATLVVVDHPYAVVSDDKGAFSIPNVAAGAVTVVAFGAVDGSVRRAEKQTKVVAGGTTAIQLLLQANP